MARKTTKGKAVRTTSWRTLAVLGILALIALSFLAIRSDTPLPTLPDQPALPVPSPAPLKDDAITQPSKQKPSSSPEAAAPPKLPSKSPLPPEVPVLDEPEQPLATQKFPESSGVAEPDAGKQAPGADASSQPSEIQSEKAPLSPEQPALQPPKTPPGRSIPLESTPGVEQQEQTGVIPQDSSDKHAPNAMRQEVDTSVRSSPVTDPGADDDMPFRGKAPKESAGKPDFVCYFSFDADTLAPHQREALRHFLRSLGPDVSTVHLEGHADSIGPEAYNTALSGNRAAYVAAVTAAVTGFDASRISTEAWGESRPAVANLSPTHRALNRRVAVYLTSGPKPPSLVRQKLGPLLRAPSSARPTTKGKLLTKGKESSAVMPPSETKALSSGQQAAPSVPRARAEAPEEQAVEVQTVLRRENENFPSDYESLLRSAPLATIHFAFDSSHMSQSETQTLLDALQSLPSGTSLTLVAHTDAVGSQAYNLHLARKRGLAVATVLLEKGFLRPPDMRILVLGEVFPHCPVPSGKAVPQRCNRRVEVFVQLQAGGGKTAQNSSGGVRHLSSSKTLIIGQAPYTLSGHNILALKPPDV